MIYLGVGCLDSSCLKPSVLLLYLNVSFLQIWEDFSHNFFKHFWSTSLLLLNPLLFIGWHSFQFSIDLVCCFLFFLSFVFLLFWLGDFHYFIFQITCLFLCCLVSCSLLLDCFLSQQLNYLFWLVHLYIFEIFVTVTCISVDWLLLCSRKSCPTLLQPLGLYLARLLCPCNFPGKNTGVGWHFLLQGIFQMIFEPPKPCISTDNFS